MTEQISAAIAKAITKVKILGKEDRNTHGNYNFASIDKFLEMVNPILGSVGVFVIPDMVDMSTYKMTTRNGESTWAKYTFQLTAYHESGESLPPVTSIVCVQLTGAQASGSAQSYALKQFYRGLLLIPTGDRDDPDFNKPEEILDGDPIQGLKLAVDSAIASMSKVDNFADLKKVWNSFNKEVREHPKAIAAKDERKAYFDQLGDGPAD